MITTGVTGSRWRASITPWGAVQPWDGEPIEWYVAADDRWHVPSHEPAVRQERIDGTPVTETRVRVPNGDVVQRVYSVVDGGGITVIEVENDSTLPVAVAFDRGGVLTERPIADVPIEGIELPSTAFVLPLGHRATLRVGLPHGTLGDGRLPSGLPTAIQVARGWTLLADRASRFVLPGGERGAALAERVTTERCELALGVVPHAADDPVAFCVALGELVRMGEDPEQWLPELVDAVAMVGPMAGWAADAALVAADRVLLAAGERRARRDLARIRADRPPSTLPADVPSGILAVPWLEQLLVDGPALLPAGFPDGWLGQSIETYGLPTLGSSAVSFAIRWHGARPAVLWEQSGDPVELSAPVLAPDWRTDDATGEALWPVPPGAEPVATDEPVAQSDEPTAPGVVEPPDDPVSFS